MIIYDFLSKIFGSQVVGILLGSLVPLIFLVPFALFAVYLERKVSGHIQDRLGPMRTGWHGWLQTVADITKLMQKEDITSVNADKMLFNIAPVLTFIGCYATFAVIPFTSAYIGSNIDLGLLYIVAVSGFVVAGILMGGWASNNKYSLLGAMRSAAQVVSYEIPTVLIIVSIIVVSDTLSLYELSEKQTANIFNWWIFGGWAIGWKKIVLIPAMIIGFLIMFTSTLAEVNRTPFDIPEAESELVAGYHTEYTGMKFAMFFLAEYANMFGVSVIVATVFFGGYQSPFGYLGNLFNAPWLIPIEQFIWFSLKGLFFVFVQMWIRWTLPRLRVDQLMTMCWKYLIPIAFVDFIIIAVIMII
ncbi:MAG: NADH-quinone oxidoreductase subunit NuoH [Ignavibacterium sp.]